MRRAGEVEVLRLVLDLLVRHVVKALDDLAVLVAEGVGGVMTYWRAEGQKAASAEQAISHFEKTGIITTKILSGPGPAWGGPVVARGGAL